MQARQERRQVKPQPDSGNVMPPDDALLDLLRRFQHEGVDYLLIGGQAVRLNGFVRATEDIDILLPSSSENGRRVIRALGFLKSSKDLNPARFKIRPTTRERHCSLDAGTPTSRAVSRSTGASP